MLFRRQKPNQLCRRRRIHEFENDSSHIAQRIKHFSRNQGAVHSGVPRGAVGGGGGNILQFHAFSRQTKRGLGGASAAFREKRKRLTERREGRGNRETSHGFTTQEKRFRAHKRKINVGEGLHMLCISLCSSPTQGVYPNYNGILSCNRFIVRQKLKSSRNIFSQHCENA